MNLPDFPFTPHYADIHGQRMHYLDEGPRDGELVVMLHGNPSWSYYYRKLVTGLKDQYRCIVPDHIGMGRSARPRIGEYPFTFTRRADDLGELLDHLGITGNITLVLHDWGGMIGMTWATRHPERIKRLIILNTAAFHLPAEKNLPPSLRLSRVPVLNALLNQGLNAFCLGAVRYGVVRPMLADAAAGYLAPYDSWSRRLAVRRFVEDIPIQPQDPGYDTVTAVADRLIGFRSLPMLICWGMHDFVFDEHFLNEWHRRFPDAEVHRFETAGHYVLEDAGDEITTLVKNFLRSNPV
jgi:pimeloyl-ACP methyl ester carboxylesterase